jgi:hypothetical protein
MSGPPSINRRIFWTIWLTRTADTCDAKRVGYQRGAPEMLSLVSGGRYLCVRAVQRKRDPTPGAIRNRVGPLCVRVSWHWL